MSVITSLVGPVSGLLDKFVEDKDQKAKLAHEIATMGQRHAQEAMLAQLEINKNEAASRNVFIAGWRPFIGWSCGVALAWTYVITPVLHFILAQTGNLVELPAMDMSQMMPVLLGMLGLGGLRSFEKYKGISKLWQTHPYL